MSPSNCPGCNTPWKEEQTIYEHFLEKYQDETKARKAATSYGCTPDNPRHLGKDVIGIQIQGQYDGVCQWRCNKCNTSFDRWTLKPIKENK